jgi:hypothetical protein
MDEAKLIENFTVEELTDELISRMGGLSCVDIDDLISELFDRKGVSLIEQCYNYKQYVIAIEDGEIVTGSGKVRILIVEG